MKTLTVLTFNWHEPYLFMLAKTGHSLEVVEPDTGFGSSRCWDIRSRPLPDNVSIIPFEFARDRLGARRYDLALLHNFADVKKVAEYDLALILLFHNKLTTELAIGGNTVDREKYLECVIPLADRVDALVFVSESKRDDWALEGNQFVIPPGLAPSDFGSYTGFEKKVLFVGNRIRERNIMLGHDLQEQIADGFDSTLIGANPSIANSSVAKNFDELKSCYAKHRVYLNTTMEPYEDGYNLAMLEAMTTGTPVVSYYHSDSPITDGVNGYLSDNIAELRSYISDLLSDREKAVRIGACGKETALKMFDMNRFILGWNRVFRFVLERTAQKTSKPVSPGAKP